MPACGTRSRRAKAICAARAVVSDSRELAAAHDEYIQLIASQRGVELRAFPNEKAARDWLLAAGRAPGG